MVTLSHPKSPMSLHIFSTMNKQSPASSLSSSPLATNTKLKTIIHNLIFSHIYKVIRAVTKAKTVFLEIFKENQLLCLKIQPQKKSKYSKKLLFGSFRLHYNWCSSSHVMPIPSTMLEGISVPASHIYYDSTWNSVFSADDLHDHQDQPIYVNGNDGEKILQEEEGQLSSYLQWLEEKGGKQGKHSNFEGEDDNEIDKLADVFIASCHEKFKLEKIESYRRYQEMLARSM